MKKYIFIAAAAFAALLSCSKSEQPNNETNGTGFQKGQQVTLHVTAGEPSTRVSSEFNADRETVDFKWEEGDKIKVTVNGQSKVFKLSSGAGTNDATFTGTMPASGDNFDVQYPDKDVEESALASQTYTSEEALPKGLMLFSKSGCTGTSFTLEAQYAALRLNLWGTDQTISKIVVTNTTSTAATKPTYTLNINGGKTLSSNSSNPTPFFIVVPAGKPDWIFSAEVFDNASAPASICTFTPSAAQAFDPNTVLNMPVKEVAVPAPSPVISGDFTISAGEDGTQGTSDDVVVKFSKGNLQATCTAAGDATTAAYSWGFAANQWDYIGNAAGNTTIGSQTKDAVVDLFGWSTSATNYGISTSTSLSSYPGDFSDWAGIATLSQISGRKWKTMTLSEWKYLLDTRSVNGGTGEGKSYRRATINNDVNGGVYGLIIYPDNYTSQTSVTTYTTSQWSEMENAGCVFLPAAGYRNGSSLFNDGSSGGYWSSSPYSTNRAHYLQIASQYIYTAVSFRLSGSSVRLVSAAQ